MGLARWDPIPLATADHFIYTKPPLTYQSSDGGKTYESLNHVSLCDPNLSHRAHELEPRTPGSVSSIARSAAALRTHVLNLAEWLRILLVTV